MELYFDFLNQSIDRFDRSVLLSSKLAFNRCWWPVVGDSVGSWVKDWQNPKSWRNISRSMSASEWIEMGCWLVGLSSTSSLDPTFRVYLFVYSQRSISRTGRTGLLDKSWIEQTAFSFSRFQSHKVPNHFFKKRKSLGKGNFLFWTKLVLPRFWSEPLLSIYKDGWEKTPSWKYSSVTMTT